MPFILLHKLASYFLASLSFLAMMLADVANPLYGVLGVFLIVTSWFVEPTDSQLSSYKWVWNILTVGIFVLFVVLYFIGTISVFIELAFFVLLLLFANRLFNRHELTDYFQMYLIAFLMLTFSSLFNESLSFAICFVFFVLSLSWSLLLYHLRKERENEYRVQNPDCSRDQMLQALSFQKWMDGKFFLTVSALSLVTFLFSGGLFFIFPRFGFNWIKVPNPPRRGLAKSGFSDTLSLGGFGKILKNSEVAFRVEFPQEKTLKRKLTSYWRGFAYDTFNGISWSKNMDSLVETSLSFPEARLNLLSWNQQQKCKSFEREQLITLSVFNPPMLVSLDMVGSFVIHMPASQKINLKKQPKFHYNRHNHSVYFSNATVKHYSAYSFERTQCRRKKLRLSSKEQKTYKELPAFLMGPVAKLVDSIVKKQHSDEEKIQRIRDYLQKNYQYTLERKRPEKKQNPMLDFLFHQKKGHCEFFASAMSVLLRSVGIASRVAVGYRGGEKNGFDDYYVIRQKDAHAWVEVFLEGKGWVREDPTPTIQEETQNKNVVPSRLNLKGWNGFWDAVQYRWYRYVIKYDLNTQVQAVIGFWRFLQTKRQARSKTFSIAKPQKKGLGKFSWRQGGLFFFFVVLLLAGFGLWRFFYKRRDFVVFASLVYSRVLKKWSQKGHPKKASETAEEFLSRLQKELDHLLPIFSQITEQYTCLRFREEPLTEESKHSFEQLALRGIDEIQSIPRKKEAND